MRWMMAAALMLASFSVAHAQEAIPREEAIKIAFQLCRNLPKMLETSIPTDPDVKRPVGFHGDERGLLVFPECKLNQVNIDQVGTDGAAIGQLWLVRLALTVDGKAVAADKLQVVPLDTDRGHLTPALYALGVRKGSDGKPELVIYGKSKEPLQHVALTTIAEKQDSPIEVSAALEGDGVAVTMKISGKYSATFPLSLSE